MELRLLSNFELLLWLMLIVSLALMSPRHIETIHLNMRILTIDYKVRDQKKCSKVLIHLFHSNTNKPCYSYILGAGKQITKYNCYMRLDTRLDCMSKS